MNNRLRASGLLLFVAMLWYAPTSMAQPRANDDATARALFNSGRAYFDAARYDDAAEAFGEAYRLSHRPQLLVNQARALEASRRSADAIVILEQAQREVPSEQAELHAEIQGRLVRLRAEVERERTEAAAQAAAVAAAPPETPVTTDTPAPRRGRFLGGVATGSVAVASLAVALGTGLRSNAIERDLEGACPGNVCPIDRAGDAARGQRLARTNTAFVFVAAGSAAAAIPLLILGIRDLRHGSNESSDGSPEVALSGGPGDVGLGIDVRF